MKRFVSWSELKARLPWLLMSVPIYVKILGIGAAVALLFGGITLPQARLTMSRVLYRALEQQTLAIGRSLAAGVERSLITGDLFSVSRRVREAQETYPDLEYVIVRSQSQKAVAHTFPDGIPPDLSGSDGAVPHGKVRILGSSGGLIFDTSLPVLGGRAGTVQVGLVDRRIQAELSSLTSSLLWSLMLCASIGSILALVLTDILTRPVRRLVASANRIRQGDFQARAKISSADEIGRLALAFDQMADSLENYRSDVLEKERARVSLIERIVQIQEEERKRVSRELHDEVGQSLSALLMEIRSRVAGNSHCEKHREELERRVTQLIDEVHRLAWGMRPSILDDFGLDSALSRLVEEISEHSETQIDYEYSAHPGAGRVPGQVEVALYRLAQEAIANTERHAQARRASVVVLQRPREVTLLVEDDGKGFDAKAAERNGDTCLGLTGMKERVALLGGTFDIESEPGKGTTLRVAIPFSEALECPSES